jgi:hypothetical protein
MGRRLRLWLAVASGVLVLTAGLGVYWGWRQWQTTPVYQFREARDRWERRPFRHYRLSANYTTNWAQCHYDIEVRDEKIRHTFGLTCLSAESAQTLTVEGIFENFERYASQRICAATGCYCDGTYVLRATYHPEYGYPQRITTRFMRNWLDDLMHGQYGKQSCRRADVLEERLEVVSVEPLP